MTTKIIIYNQSKYIYSICEIVYETFKNYINNIEMVNCSDHDMIYNDDTVYLTFYKFNDDIVHPKKYIVYNFEQLTTEKKWSEEYINYLRNALYVIDYSLSNVIWLNSIDINSYFLPFETLDTKIYRSLKSCDKDIDILFIGSLNDRRKKWLNRLIYLNSQLTIKIITNKFNKDSYDFYTRSKILLNIHYYEQNRISEISRIIHALENSCIVLTESSDDFYYNQLLNGIVTITNYDTLNDDVINILSDYNNIQKNKNDLYTNMLEYKNIDYINSIVGLFKIIIG
jgi:hypothetical protein